MKLANVKGQVVFHPQALLPAKRTLPVLNTWLNVGPLGLGFFFFFFPSGSGLRVIWGQWRSPHSSAETEYAAEWLRLTSLLRKGGSFYPNKYH